METGVLIHTQKGEAKEKLRKVTGISFAAQKPGELLR